MENWKEIKGYEGRYEVSDKGKIRSLNYRNQKGVIKEMTPSLSNVGYLMFPLPFNKKQKSVCVHRIVAETYTPALLRCIRLHRNLHKSECALSFPLPCSGVLRPRPYLS